MSLSDDEIAALKKAADQRYEAKIRAATVAAQREREQDYQAIEHVAQLQRQVEMADDAEESAPPVSRANGTRLSWPGLRAAVRNSLNHMPHRFTLDQVAQRLQAVYPEDTAELNRTYLSGELWRLKERGEIVVHKAGAGRRPAIYKKGTDSEE